ncbi:MAG: hypothetical protein A2075_04115 [Geobacteraceae bacterium GWC2_58_44]|nr:MAG: hypothetical protein A2075_04115 [Geobacteraceae bacterium GWC2_58_44]HBG05911.1 hypothetical protein [Geobacter sp.]
MLGNKVVKLVERRCEGQDFPNLSILSINLLFVMVRFWPSILHCYFRYDDFEFFSANRTDPLLQLTNMLHGDHALPLYRYQVALMEHIFGVDPIYYNVFTLLTFVMVLNVTWLLFRKLKYSDASFLLFSVLFLGWSNWGEMTTGYFCLIPYSQLSLCSLISIWCCLQWQVLKSVKYQLLAILFLFLAVFVDISGIWVPFGVLLFVVHRTDLPFQKSRTGFCQAILLAAFSCSGSLLPLRRLPLLCIRVSASGILSFHVRQKSPFPAASATADRVFDRWRGGCCLRAPSRLRELAFCVVGVDIGDFGHRLLHHSLPGLFGPVRVACEAS